MITQLDFLLDYPYFKEHFKKQAPDADPKAIKQISFTENLDETGNATMFFTSRRDRV